VVRFRLLHTVGSNFMSSMPPCSVTHCGRSCVCTDVGTLAYGCQLANGKP
jgi:hypothetical protein